MTTNKESEFEGRPSRVGCKRIGERRIKAQTAEGIIQSKKTQSGDPANEDVAKIDRKG